MTDPTPPVQILQVVRTDLHRRGDDTTGNPSRRIVQFWSPEGVLLAESDPGAPTHCNAIGHLVRPGATTCERCGAQVLSETIQELRRDLLQARCDTDIERQRADGAAAQANADVARAVAVAERERLLAQELEEKLAAASGLVDRLQRLERREQQLEIDLSRAVADAAKEHRRADLAEQRYADLRQVREAELVALKATTLRARQAERDLAVTIQDLGVATDKVRKLEAEMELRVAPSRTSRRPEWVRYQEPPAIAAAPEEPLRLYLDTNIRARRAVPDGGGGGADSPSPTAPASSEDTPSRSYE